MRACTPSGTNCRIQRAGSRLSSLTLVGNDSMSPFPWKQAKAFEDIRYEKWEGMAKITINRPEVRNAFRPQTLFELTAAFEDARNDSDVGVIILTGEGKDAFCSGGDQRVRGHAGYVGKDGVPRLNVLDLQK